MSNVFEEIVPDLFHVRDTVNVYVLRRGQEAVAIDFGSGRWTERLGEIGVTTLRHVLLTHGHRDQGVGLNDCAAFVEDVRAPRGDAWMFDGDELATFWKTYHAGGCPRSYLAPREGMPVVRAVMGEAGDLIWGDIRMTAIPTPGHTRGALTYLTVWGDRQVAFCGDAAHAGGTIHEPYHLEWDHWTGEGALDAWHGLDRLGGVGIDVLCPSHGEVVTANARETVQKTAARVMAFVKAKGSVCAGARDTWHPLKPLGDLPGAWRVLDRIALFGGNTFLLANEEGEGLVVDPTEPTIGQLDAVMAATGVERITAAIATHYHRDHSDGLDIVRERHGAEVWLHDVVAIPLADRDALDVPWLPARPIVADRALKDGDFTWGGYTFGLRHFPGQTWWHCAFDTTVDGRHVLFSGDNFQPATRWNGTGGFCAYNGCRFTEGFEKSARIAVEIAPDIVCNGHGCVYAFSRDHYERIVTWSREAEKAVAELCATGDLSVDYDPRRAAPVGASTPAAGGSADG